MILSILIPSHNRGHLAYKRVLEMLELGFEKEFEIIVVTDNSSKNVEGYKRIAEIDNPRVVYKKFDCFMEMLPKIREGMKIAQGDFILICSDEDSIIPDYFATYMSILPMLMDQVAIIRAHTSKQYSHINENRIAQKGREAIDMMYLLSNYISGTIYNRQKVSDKDFGDLFSKYTNDNKAFYYYNHMMFETPILIRDNVMECKYPLIKEAPTENELINMTEEDKDSYPFGMKHVSIEGRMEQMKGFTEQIRDVEAPDDLKLHMFTKLINSMIGHIYRVTVWYVANLYNRSELYWNIEQEMKKIAHESDIQVVLDNIEIVDRCIEEYVRGALVMYKTSEETLK